MGRSRGGAPVRGDRLRKSISRIVRQKAQGRGDLARALPALQGAGFRGRPAEAYELVMIGSTVGIEDSTNDITGALGKMTIKKRADTMAKELWGDRFQMVVTTHLNTEHIHNHFVINSVSFKNVKTTKECFLSLRVPFSAAQWKVI